MIARASKRLPLCTRTSAWRLRPDSSAPSLTRSSPSLSSCAPGSPRSSWPSTATTDAIGWCERRTCPWGSTTPATFVAATRLTVDAWDSTICDAAKTHDFTCVDVYHAFNGPQGADAAGDLLAADYIHPSQLGNDRIADLLAEEGFAPLVP